MSTPKVFLSNVIRVCKENEIELILSPNKNVYTLVEGATVAGFFDEDVKILSVAVARDDWLMILAHEFSHLEQYCDGQFLSKDFGETSPYTIIDRWIFGAKYSNAEIDRAFDFAIECELDAERRTLGHITRHSLGSGQEISDYISDANGYILTYKCARKMRRWPQTKDWSTTSLVSSTEITPSREINVSEQAIKFLFGESTQL